LLDTNVDVHHLLIARNREEDVLPYLPFDNVDKVKVTVRSVADFKEWEN
jgi:hypothetical protein